MPASANTYSGPIETSIPYRPTGVPKMSWTPPHGIRASAPTAVRIAITGAILNRKPTDVVGRKGSLVANLTISASGCSSPKGPTRLGP